MSDLQDAAAWLVRAGYPTDWDSTEAPPAALREAVIDAIHADPQGNLHGNELTRDEVAAWLAFEGRGFTPTPPPWIGSWVDEEIDEDGDGPTPKDLTFATRAARAILGPEGTR